MTDVPPSPARRRWWKYLLILFVAGVVCLGVAAWYMTTDSFQAYVRGRIVSAMEKATGGRVELGTYHTIPFRLQVEVRDLTVHGLEGPGEVALAHVDRAVARIKVISLLETSFGFKSVVLDHPVVHLIVYPDGRTNLPEPKIRVASPQSPVEQLFSLSIRQLEVHRGEFLWNDHQVPFDFNAADVSADMTYSFFRGRYESNLLLGKVDTHFQNYQPFSWMASAHFSLGKNDVEVSSLKWNSGRSRLEASGRVTGFQKPKIEATYTGTVDLAEVAAISKQREIHAGLLDLNGKGTWSAEKIFSDGKVALKNFEYRDDQLALRDATISSDFSVSERQIKLSRAQGRLLGGSVTGDAEITNWQAPLPPVRGVKATKEKEKKPEEQRGILRLHLKDVSAGAIAAAFSTRQNPLDGLNLAGSTDGTIEADWTGSLSRADAEFGLNLVPPANLQPHQLPLTATARGIYRASADELELTQLDANTHATQVHASGKLAAAASLQISASTSNLDELQPFIVAVHGPSHLPVILHGSARFTGLASGKLSTPSLAGHLQIQDFESLLPATDREPQRPVHWDSFAADVQLSPHNVALRHATAVHGDTTAHFDVSAALSHGTFSPDDTFTANLNLQNADVAEIEALLGYQYSVTGSLNLTAQAGGTRDNPHADGHLQLNDAIVDGEPLQQFDSDLRWFEGEASLNNIHVSYYDAQATGGAAYNPATRTYHFNFTGKNFDLARVPVLQTTRIPVEGRVDFTAQGSGTPEVPAINAKILVRDLTLDHERTGNLTIDAATQGETVHLTAASDFEHSQFNLDGSVRPREDYLADLNLHFSHLDLDSILREYLHGRVAGHSGITGHLQLRGSLRRPRELNVVATLDGLDMNVDEVKLNNQGPIRLSMAQQTVRLEQLHILGEDTDFSAHGTASLMGNHDLDFAADGHLNLQLIQTLNPGFTSSGMVDVALTVAGSVADPLLQGKVNVSHGSIAYLDLPSGLSDMNGSLVFNRNRLQIENLTAHSGGGTLTLSGEASTYAGQINFDFSAKAQDVRLRYPPGVSSTANADVRFYGTRESSTLSGDVMVTKLAITPGFDFAAYASGGQQSVVVPPATSPLYRVKLDVHVTTAPDLQMQTAIARLSGDADLRLRGTAAKPALLGRVEVLEGEINFNGAKYRLERGEVMFQSPVSIRPVLDLQATTRVRDYDITVSINGDTGKPLGVKYRSDPPLPEADIVALLAVGQTREQSAQLAQSGSSPFSETASNLILSEALNATVSNRVQKLFGVSKIKIDPQGLSTETNPTRGPQVTIEQQISNMFTLTYSQNVSQASQQIIQGEYYLKRNVSIVGTRDQNGVVSFDVKIRQRKK
ncbi:MAG TPA: translocation/assembly module TamB domain-containing protein [Terriglobales bacterium]|nr:translocation/assembly module TamB domain-containing protein [Terriglobales bacterium]